MKHIKKFESYSLNEWFFNRKPESEIEEEKRRRMEYEGNNNISLML
jgi:hypothetical protein